MPVVPNRAAHQAMHLVAGQVQPATGRVVGGATAHCPAFSGWAKRYHPGRGSVRHGIGLRERHQLSGFWLESEQCDVPPKALPITRTAGKERPRFVCATRFAWILYAKPPFQGLLEGRSASVKKTTDLGSPDFLSTAIVDRATCFFY